MCSSDLEPRAEVTAHRRALVRRDPLVAALGGGAGVGPGAVDVHPKYTAAGSLQPLQRHQLDAVRGDEGGEGFTERGGFESQRALTRCALWRARSGI